MLYYTYHDPLVNYVSKEERALNEYMRLEYKWVNKDRGCEKKGLHPIIYHFLLRK